MSGQKNKELYDMIMAGLVPGVEGLSPGSMAKKENDFDKWYLKRNAEFFKDVRQEFNQPLSSLEENSDLGKWAEVDKELHKGANQEKANNSLAPNMKVGIER